MFDIKYHTWADRCRGVSARIIYMYAEGAVDRLTLVDLDDADSQYLWLAPAYEAMTSSGISPRSAWIGLIKDFRLQGGMVIADALCRQPQMPSAARSWLADQLVKEGEDSCQLTRDEVNDLFAEPWEKCRRLFAHPAVRESADHLEALFEADHRPEVHDVVRVLAHYLG